MLQCGSGKVEPLLSNTISVCAIVLSLACIQITLACLIRARQWERKREVSLPYHHPYPQSSPPLSPTHFILSAVSQADFANWFVKSPLISQGLLHPLFWKCVRVAIYNYIFTNNAEKTSAHDVTSSSRTFVRCTQVQ